MTQWFSNGGWIMFPLLVCSLLAGTVIIERSLFLFAWRRKVKKIDRIHFLGLLKNQKGALAMREAQKSTDPLLNSLWPALKFPPSQRPTLLFHFSSEILDQWNRFLPILGTITTAAPMLGILGTVSGIIKSFGFISQQTLQNQKGIIGGLSEALITTEYGLLIAIPTLIFFQFYERRIQGVSDQLQKFSTEIEILGTPPRQKEKELAPLA